MSHSRSGIVPTGAKCKLGIVDSPRHLKTRACVKRGLFDGLTSFRELEGRISALATKGERGDAFEVFAEAYLATLAVNKAKHVWPGASVPPSLRKRLALTIGDNGVDGIFETPLGEYHAYQSKFRTGRPSLTWNELSTFIGLADRVEQRVLFTNCDRFAGLVKERTAFYAITGNDLDKLEPRDFAAIRAWLEGAKVERTPKTPLPHQDEALGDILPALPAKRLAFSRRKPAWEKSNSSFQKRKPGRGPAERLSSKANPLRSKAGSIFRQIPAPDDSLRALLRAQVFEQAGEGGLEGVVLLPVREVGDEVFAQFDGEILAAVGIEALPVAQRLHVHQPHGEALAMAALAPGFERPAQFGHHPPAGLSASLGCSCSHDSQQ